MEAMLKIVDRISSVFIAISCTMLVVLVAVTLTEVFARYVLESPTLWAFDIVNLANGALFLLAAAFAERANRHVNIDVFSRLMPEPVRRALFTALTIMFVLPTIFFLAWVATEQTWNMIQSGRPVESAWAPPRWPFYLPMAVGLWSLWLQCQASTLRNVAAMRGA